MPKFSDAELEELQARTLELEARKNAKSDKPKRTKGSKKESKHASSVREKLVAPFLLLVTLLISMVFYYLYQ